MSRRRQAAPESIDPAWLIEQLAGPAEAFRIPLPPIADELARFCTELLRWNARINLTGARDAAALVRSHIADALAVVSLLPPAPAQWIDVGSGAGLPGLVMAIARPDLRGILLEPMEKRRVFLLATQRALHLGNLVVSADRAEQHLVRGNAASCDAAVARAVFPLEEWLSLGRRFVRPGGIVIGLEGSRRIALGPGAERLPYDLGTGPRALIRVRC